MKKRQEITKAEAEILAQKKLEKFYKSMEKAGYHLEPIPELGDPEKDLREFFFDQLKEKYIIKD